MSSNDRLRQPYHALVLSASALQMLLSPAEQVEFLTDAIDACERITSLFDGAPAGEVLPPRSSTPAGPSLFAEYQPRPMGGTRGTLADGVIVRPAHPNDLDGLAKLIAQRGNRSPDDVRERCACELGALPAEDRLLLIAARDAEVLAFGRARYLASFQFAPGEPAGPVPEGWYLTGLIVAPALRRRGIGAQITRRRLAWVAGRATRTFYFANSINRPSIELHAQFGFRESVRDFKFPGVTFSGVGCGILFSVDLLDPAVMRLIAG
jgi:GNAT superfamily N-acetyltransferase